MTTWDEKSRDQILADIQTLISGAWGTSHKPTSWEDWFPSSTEAVERLHREAERKRQHIFQFPWEVQVRVSRFHPWSRLQQCASLEEACRVHATYCGSGLGILVRIRAR